MVATLRLGLNLQEVGSNFATWGGILNDQAIALLDEAHGVATIFLTGNTTLALANFVSSPVRKGTLVFKAGMGLSASPTITMPQTERTWIVVNDTTYPLTFSNAGGSTSLPSGRKAQLMSDGSVLRVIDASVEASDSALTATAAAAQAAASAGTASGAASTASTSAGQAMTYRNQAQTYANNAAQSASDAASFSPTNYYTKTQSDSFYMLKTGGQWTGSVTSKVQDHGSKGSVTETFSYSDGNTHKVTCTGNLVISPTNLVEGGVMQVNMLYQSGTPTVSGTTYWELGGGTKSTTFADLGITFTASTPYRIIFEMVGGVRTGIIQ